MWVTHIYLAIIIRWSYKLDSSFKGCHICKANTCPRSKCYKNELEKNEWNMMEWHFVCTCCVLIYSSLSHGRVAHCAVCCVFYAFVRFYSYPIMIGMFQHRIWAYTNIALKKAFTTAKTEYKWFKTWVSLTHTPHALSTKKKTQQVIHWILKEAFVFIFWLVFCFNHVRTNFSSAVVSVSVCVFAESAQHVTVCNNTSVVLLVSLCCFQVLSIKAPNYVVAVGEWVSEWMSCDCHCDASAQSCSSSCYLCLNICLLLKHRRTQEKGLQKMRK